MKSQEGQDALTLQSNQDDYKQKGEFSFKSGIKQKEQKL